MYSLNDYTRLGIQPFFVLFIQLTELRCIESIRALVSTFDRCKVPTWLVLPSWRVFSTACPTSGPYVIENCASWRSLEMGKGTPMREKCSAHTWYCHHLKIKLSEVGSRVAKLPPSCEGAPSVTFLSPLFASEVKRFVFGT